MSGNRVFSGTHMRAELFDENRDKLIVTFDFRRLDRAGFVPIEPSRGHAAAGFAQLTVLSAQNDWFINPDTAALEAVLATLAGVYGTVHTTGYSMGGYGAFRFAKVLKARSVVVVSPQITLDRAEVPFEKRYVKETARFDARLGRIPKAPTVETGLIHVDPFIMADLAHAKLLQARFPAVPLARLGFGGHPAIGVLRRARKARLVGEAARAQWPDGGAVVAAHRAARATDSEYFADLSKAAFPRRAGLATAALIRSEALEG